MQTQEKSVHSHIRGTADVSWKTETCSGLNPRLIPFQTLRSIFHALDKSVNQFLKGIFKSFGHFLFCHSDEV